MTSGGASVDTRGAPRSPLRTGSPRPASANVPEIEQLFQQLRRVVVDVDEARVQRSFRHWLSWIHERGTSAPFAVVVLPGDALSSLSPTLAEVLARVQDPLVELRPHGQRSAKELPWP